MIENIDLKAGTFELNGQVIEIPEGIDIHAYIDSEIEVLEVFDAIESEDEAA